MSFYFIQKTKAMPTPTVIKRSGDRVAYDKTRIFNAIKKAAEATGEFEVSEARKIADVTDMHLQKMKKDGGDLTVEEIQDLVEFALMSSGHHKTARAYIVYRDKRAQARASQGVAIEVEKTISEYLNQSDWRVHANANQGYSLGGLIYATKWPDPIPHVLGFHEIFHFFVLGGSLAHFVFILRYVHRLA